MKKLIIILAVAVSCFAQVESYPPSVNSANLPATAVQTNKTNTYTTGDQNLSSATQMEIPVVAGCNPATNGGLCYDSTQGVMNFFGGTGTAAKGSARKVLSVQLGGADASTGLVAATINVTETAFATTYTIPANYLIANKVLHATWVMDETTSGTPVTQRARIRLGGVSGTIVFDSTAVTPSINLAGRVGVFEAYIVGTAAAGASVNVETGTGGCCLSPTTPFNIYNTVAQPVLVATNASQVLTLTMQFSGNTAGNTVKLRSMIVEELN